MDYANVLKELSVFPGVSGYEKKLSEYVVKLFKQYCDDVQMDKFYNVIGIKRGTSNARKKIMVTAHLDEIGMMVKSIHDKGFVKFTNIGGIDTKILPAQEVVIHGKRDLPGIIGAKPPHLLKKEEVRKAVKMDDMAIDTGLSSEEIKDVVSIGDIITFKVEPVELKNNKFSSKSLDNRSGVAALIDVMENLAKLNHQCDVYFAATVQEEVGLRGARITAYNIYPDLAVVLDACQGDIPDVSKDEIYTLGKGPAIAVGPNLHKGLMNNIIKIAKDENIPYQIDVEPGNTGTEAWAIQVSRSGIPTALISIPLRYMHTTIETLNIDDIKYTGRLVSRFISTIEDGTEEISCF